MGGSGGMMGPPPSLGDNPLPASDAVVTRGKPLYEANCAACHGPQGRGDRPGAAGLNPRPPDLRGAAAS
jgi:mono/diheme cytochrome c family protein